MDWAQAQRELEVAASAGRGPSAAIALWASTRHHALRALAPPPSQQPTPDIELEAWAAAAGPPGPPSSERVAQLAQLLATAPYQVAKLALATIARQGPDPRWAQVLERAAATRADLLDRKEARTELTRAVLTHADTGLRPLLEALQRTPNAKRRAACRDRLEALREVEVPPPGWVERVAARLAASPPPVPRPSARTEEELWARVYAQPDDLEARAVLSDALTERGDPRGPFIAAQLAGDDTQPPPDLARRFLAPIAEGLAQSTVRFARGFPVSATFNVRLSSQRRAAVLLAREWGTFERLDWLETLAPTLRSLRTARHLGKRGLEGWLKHRWPLPLIDLGAPAELLPKLGALPTPVEVLELRELFLEPDFQLSAILEPLVALPRLRKVTFPFPLSRGEALPAGAWPRWSEDLRRGPWLEEVWWEHPNGYTLGLTSAAQRFDTLRVRVRDFFALETLPDVLADAAQVWAPARQLQVEGDLAAEVEPPLAAAWARSR